ncbi:MAG: hypothetical protein UW89_C0004G0007 [Parcubacteria group bacterium GW2011_GWB1_45_10]|nr:MAG: hypothetical protein UW89_C0004G0007 [Parcubacteria group bacterium GW2011_GWB1_45_10]
MITNPRLWRGFVIIGLMKPLNKQKIINLVLQELDKKKLELNKSVEDLRKSASESSKSMESWSDSSRTQFNMMAGALNREVATLDSAASFLKNLGGKSGLTAAPGSLVVVKESGKEKSFFLVPEGSGGFTVKVDGIEVLVVALTSPIGDILSDKRIGETVAFNELSFEIVSFE